jgi:anti-sigma B factor antagonist
MNLSVRRTVIGDINVVVVEGEVDMATVPQLSDALSRLVTDTRGHSCAVDLDGVQLLDDAALGILLGAAARARSTGGELIVVCTSEKLRLRFAETRFDQAVHVRSTITDV